jgi:hypothetical protein
LVAISVFLISFSLLQIAAPFRITDVVPALLVVAMISFAGRNTLHWFPTYAALLDACMDATIGLNVGQPLRRSLARL